MKSLPIELNSEQVAKLYDMLRGLFAQNEDFEGHCNVEICPPPYNATFVTEYWDDGTVRTHWYEFVMLHLAPRLIERLDKKELALPDGELDFGRDLYQVSDIQDEEDIISFLYEEFKLL